MLAEFFAEAIEAVAFPIVAHMVANSRPASPALLPNRRPHERTPSFALTNVLTRSPEHAVSICTRPRSGDSRKPSCIPFKGLLDWCTWRKEEDS